MPWHRTAAGAHVYVGGVDLSSVTASGRSSVASRSG
jgi:hypothetical protein